MYIKQKEMTNSASYFHAHFSIGILPKNVLFNLDCSAQCQDSQACYIHFILKIEAHSTILKGFPIYLFAKAGIKPTCICHLHWYISFI